MATVIRTVRCPGCDQLPDLVIGPGQAFCGNDDCQALMFDPSADPARFKADAVVSEVLQGLQDVVGPSPVARDKQGDPVDDARREAEIRAFFHAAGCVCAAGCPVCDPTLSLTRAQVQVVVDQLALTRAAEAPDGGKAAADELVTAVALGFGMPGLDVLRLAAVRWRERNQGGD